VYDALDAAHTHIVTAVAPARAFVSEWQQAAADHHPWMPTAICLLIVLLLLRLVAYLRFVKHTRIIRGAPIAVDR
jgi:hypothetical protein